jgi:hypothetical protein
VQYAEYPAFKRSGRSARTVIDPRVFTPKLRRELGDFFRMASAPNGDLFVTYSSASPSATNVVRIRKHPAA